MEEQNGTSAQRKAYHLTATAAEKDARDVFLRGLLASMSPEAREHSIRLMRDRAEHLHHARTGEIGHRHGGSDDPNQNGGGGSSGAGGTQDLGNGLGITAEGTLVWGQSPQTQTQIDAQNLTTVIVAAIVAAAAYLADLAWAGCGWGSVAAAAEVAMGNMTSLQTLTGCIQIGYTSGGGGECGTCY